MKKYHRPNFVQLLRIAVLSILEKKKEISYRAITRPLEMPKSP